MRSIHVFACCLFATPFLCAQSVTLRGKVEDVQGTQNQFYLDGTTIPLTSTALNLNLWEDEDAILEVTNIGAPGAPVLRVDAATVTQDLMDMGNMRLGETDSWEVRAPSGSFALVAIDWTTNTGFTPLDPFGVYLLGSDPVLLAAGFANALNEFRFLVTPPQDQTMLNLEVSAQAIVGEPSGVWYFTDVDSKVVEP